MPSLASQYSLRLDPFGNRLDVSAQVDAKGLRFKIESGKNEIGVLFRISAIFYVYGWSIAEAKISSPDTKMINDEFLIVRDSGRSALSEGELQKMVEDLERLLFRGLSVLEYLTEKNAAVPTIGDGKGKASLKRMKDKVELNIQCKDRRGLLLCLSQAFYLMDIDIAEALIVTKGENVDNHFFINVKDHRFDADDFNQRLCEELQILL